MLSNIRQVTLASLLLLPLVLSPLIGLFTPYLSLLVVAPVFFAILFTGRLPLALQSYEARAFLAVFLVFAVLFAVTADSASDVLRAFNFTMLLTYGAIAFFLSQNTRPDGARLVTQLAALGVAIGTIQIAITFVLGEERPAGFNIGPIVLANALLALGMIAAGGALLRRDRLGLLYLLVPIVAVIATLATGSRGPLLAVPFLALMGGLFFWRLRFSEVSVGRVLAGLAAVGAVMLAAAMLVGRLDSLVDIASSMVAGKAVGDESTVYRFALYEAGWQAFQLSPFIGHGWANIMQTVAPFLSGPDADYLKALPQLHNDVLNFAVAGGVVGVACYFVIVTAPLIGALRSRRDSLRPFRIYAATMLTITYVGGGLTDLMFGFEFHTFLFAMLAAIILGFCRDPEPAS